MAAPIKMPSSVPPQKKHLSPSSISFLSHMLTLFVVCALTGIHITLASSRHAQLLLYTYALLTLTGIILSRLKSATRFPSGPTHLLLATGIIGGVALVWNRFFSLSADPYTFSENIYRGAFFHFKAPLYGILKEDPFHLLFLFFALLLAITLIFLVRWLKKTNRRKPMVAVLIFYSVSLLTFNSIQQTKDSGFPPHYDLFRKDVSFFHSAGDLMSNYTNKMHLLGTHNRHYPPGNLLLFVAETQTFPHFAETIVLFSCLLSVLILSYIHRYFFPYSRCDYSASLLLVTSAPMLIFPSIALTPIVMACCLISVMFLLRAIHSTPSTNALALGISLALCLLFSFVAVFVFLLVFLFAVAAQPTKNISLDRMLRILFFTCLSFLGFFFLLFVTTRFNIIDCFLTACSITNQTARNFDTLFRYLLRSTGNLLAFVMILGSPLIVLFFQGCRDDIFKRLGYALCGLILFAGFSGIFFMETERLWLFFVPFICLIASSSLSNQLSQKQYSLTVSLFILANFLLSCVHILLLNH